MKNKVRKLIQRLSRKQNLMDEQGAAAVEFALLLPILTLIITGIMMFGLLFNSYLEITHAAREGVRWASLRSTFAEVETKAKAAAPGIDWTKAVVARTGVADPVGDADQGEPVTVTVTYDIDEIKTIFGVFGDFLPPSIQSAATQRVE